MAKREKTVVIDGYATPVGESARIADVAPVEASQVITREGEIIPRSRFATVPVPDAFDVYLSQINKGG
ncbi:MAG: hypothetical protein ACREWG_16835 [Gammaproteobacteria bacterium]